jgi:hypothetical protein
MENEEKRNVKCKRCGTYRYPSQFFSKGRELKTCQVCRDKEKIYRKKNKCPHGRQKSQCKECSGASICPHGRQKAHCKECGGTSVCKHGRMKNQCKECSGSSICPHGRQKAHCKECDGVSICEHGRRRNRCKECDGASICPHNRIRYECKDCMNDDQKIEYIQKKMISGSRRSDKKHNRYDADHFIDKPFLEGLFEDSQNCHYCDVEFTYNERIGTLVTIERLNNSIGHIKSNCVLACWDCNSRHQSRYEEIEEKSE